MACIVCKRERIPFDYSRSFHRFPKDNDLKTKWMNAIGKFSIKKTTTICSDHFDAESYHDTNGYTTLRRLLSTAVPRIPLIKEELDITSNFTKTNDIIVSENLESHNIKIEENEISEPEEITESQVSKCIVNVDSANLISHSIINNSNNSFRIAKANYPVLTIAPLETTEHTLYNDLEISNDEILKQQQHQDISGNSNNLKRKNPFIDHNLIDKKQINYRCNFKTYRFAREKFSSDDAWEEFQEFASFIKRKTATAVKKISRKQKKITKLKMVIEKLKMNNEINVAEYLQVIYREGKSKLD